MAVTHQDVLAIDLEVGHGIVRVTEVHGEIAVNIVLTLGTIEETDMQFLGMELVTNLVEFVKELSPFLGIIGEKSAFPIFLSDNKHGLDLSIFASVEIAEIGLLECAETLTVNEG
jgi:hypothetical protein